MQDKILEQLLNSRLTPPFLAFVGVVILVLWKRITDARLVAVAVLFAPTFTFVVMPSAIALIRRTPSLAWVPADGSIEGLLGCLIGMLALKLVALIDKAGSRAEALAEERITGGH